MPKLGEFIGAILSDAVQARVRADIEALKIAEIYSGHELLRHFPVPRFRLPDIAVDFPVAVAATGEAPEGPEGKFFETPQKAELTRVVRKALLAAEMRLPYPERRKIYAAVHRTANRLFKGGPQFLLNSRKVSTGITTAAAGATSGVLKTRGEGPEKLLALEGSLRIGLQSLLLEKLTKAPHLLVNVSSSDIKLHGDNESLLRVRLTISEDSYEVVSRNEGEQGYSLTPE
jgi:hypothetical protein